MGSTWKLAAALVPAALMLAAAPENSPEMQKWMKDTDTANKVLRKLEKKTGSEAVKNAETLGAVYEEMIGFWRQRKRDDAEKWSEEGKAAAVILASAAHSGDTEKAEAAYQKISGTCKSCHTAYRERLADGTYRIKYPDAPADRPQGAPPSQPAQP
jgi:hypothetical protein